MRAIKSSLAMIWLLVLVVAAGSALVERHTDRVEAPRVVYVDRAKLIMLHPAWKQVLSVRAAIADLKGEAAKPVYNGGFSVAGFENIKVDNTAKGKSRQELAHELEQRAFSELAYIESRERKKIEQDMAAKRLELESAMQAAIAQKADETDLKTASEKRDVQNTRSQGRLETELKITSIKSRLKSLSASEEQKARRELTDAQEILSAFDSETQKCITDQCESAKEELQRFKVRERLSIENELSQLRAERENQLEKNVRKQQEILIAGMHNETDEHPAGSLDKQVADYNQRHGNYRAVKYAGSADTETGIDTAKALQGLKRVEQQLVARIASEVTSTAESVAGEQGFTVTFKRGKAVRDFTERIAGAVSGPNAALANIRKSGAG